MKQLIIYTLALSLILVTGCRKPDCEENSNSTLEIIVLHINTNLYPQLPENTYVLGNIGAISSNHTDPSLVVSNEQIKVNGKAFNGSNYDIFVVGKNVIESTVDCKRPSKNSKSNDCDCSEEQKSARKEISVLDTTRVWVKSLTYWKNFNSPRPDLYLVVNNWNKKSNTSVNYSHDLRGNKIWNINDTFIISKTNFNLSITAWDADRFGKDDKVIDYFIPQDEFQNWSQDTLSYYKNGGVSLVIQKL